MDKIITESNGFKLTLDKTKDEKIILSIDNESWGKRSISMTKRQTMKLINELHEIFKYD